MPLANRPRQCSFFRALSLAIIAILPLGLGACRKSEVPAAGTRAKPRIALVMKSLANEFFGTMANGAKRYAAAHRTKLELLVNGIKDETDLAEQVSLVEQMIAMHVDAIVIAPADSKALVPALKRALAAGLVVVNIDNRLDAATLKEAGIAIPFVGPDNRAAAAAVGRALAAKLSPGDPVAIIEGIPTSDNSRQRRLGFEDAVKAAGLNLVATQSGQWEMEPANNVAAALLTAHPNLRGLLCANDNMALGAVAAIKAAGRVGQVLVVGFDHISAIDPLIASGAVVATADQHADQLAVFGIEAARELMKTKTTADRATRVDLITR